MALKVRRLSFPMWTSVNILDGLRVPVLGGREVNHGGGYHGQ